MNNETCPNLVEWYVLLCDKGNKPYSPDIFELRLYCKNGRYRDCPSWNGKVILGASTGRELYKKRIN